MTRINDNGIDRDMTDAEQTAYDKFVQDEAERIARETSALEAVAAAKASARTKLKALGLTDAEIAALVG